MVKKRNIGLENEKEYSSYFFKNGVPLLLSCRLLRKLGLGQLDFVKWIKPIKKFGHESEFSGTILIVELKTSTAPSMKQISRIKSAANFLGSLFDESVKFQIAYAKKENKM